MMRVFLILLLSIPVLCYGQFRGQGNRVVGVDFSKGFIFKHKPSLAHLITDHPWSIRLSLDKQTFGNEAWEKRYNFPDIGFDFIYMDYNNELLGKTIALIPHYNFYFTKNRQARSQFNYKIGLGLGYNTEKYHPMENNKNNALSTNVSFGILFEAGYKYKLTDRFDLVSSVSFTHFSNGSIKKPNSGINVVSANIGVNYAIKYEERSYLYPEDEPLDKTGLGYTFTFTTGMHEAYIKGGGSFPFYTFTMLVDKTLNHKSKLGIMFDWFHSRSLREEVKYQFEDDPPDFNRLGMGIAHELVVNDYSIISQVGFYIYAPWEPFEPYYFRLGLRKYFKEKLYAGLSVKSHNAKAESAEFSVGWRFR